MKKPKVHKFKQGFTVVELVIVISIIAVLAVITIVGYNGWKNTALAAQVKSDLNGEAAAMENYRTFNNVYPTSLATLTTFTPNSSDTVTLSSDSTTTNYCIDAFNTGNTSATFYLASETKDQGALSGTCATRPAAPGPPSSTPSGLAATAVSPSEIDLMWTGISGGGVTYTIQRATDSAFVYVVGEATQTGTTRASISLSSSTTYFYRVEAVTSGGTSAWSNTATATTQIPAPATGILAITASASQINYAFLAVSGAASYNVQISQRLDFSTGTVHSQTILTGTFSGLSANTVYYLRVQSVDGSGNPGPYTTAGPYGSPASESTQPLTALVVAGGGGGGGNCNSCAGGGGGGAGGLQYSTSIFAGAVGTVVNVTVGGGGAGGSGTNTVGVGDGSNGGNSSFSGGAIAVGLSTVGGGGGHAQNSTAGSAGGSGGGGSGGSSPAAGAGGAGTAGQGFSGGAGVQAGALNGGSGGGAGGPGAQGSSATGGAGLAYSISGLSLFYAGGGGAGQYTTNTPGTGGSGVGGNGANSSVNSGNGFAGMANRGGGGGGGNGSTLAGHGGNGGSGVVVFSYPTGSMTTSGGTVTTSGGNTIVTFTSSGTLTFVSFP